jgi:hypothetical protein
MAGDIRTDELIRAKSYQISDQARERFWPWGSLGTAPNLIEVQKCHGRPDAKDKNGDRAGKSLNRDPGGHLEQVQKIGDREHQDQSNGEL